jgi:DNA-binding LacI/PurR family transcriptional regulator
MATTDLNRYRTESIQRLPVYPGNVTSKAAATKRPTLDTIARALGVSRATVSNAYNRPDQLSPALRQRIISTAASLGYAGPDPAARSLRQRRVGAVGVLMADRLSYAFSDPAAVLLLDGLAEVLEPEGTGLLILPGTGGPGPPPEMVRNAVVDGLVVYCLADDDPALAAARARRLPLVLVDDVPQPRRRVQRARRTPDDPRGPGQLADGGDVGGAREVAIRINDPSGAASAAQHLLDLGHRRIAVVSYDLARDRRSGLADAERQAAIAFSSTRERLGGYRRAVVAAGLDWSDVPVWECTHNERLAGHEGAAALLATRPRPTAIIALSDELAIGALDAARDAGIDVPGQLSVVGFDDSPAATLVTPALTTVHQPLRRKGELAGERLLDLRAGRRPPRTRRLATELVIRDSTAPPPTTTRGNDPPRPRRRH